MELLRLTSPALIVSYVCVSVILLVEGSIKESMYGEQARSNGWPELPTVSLI
jgi:hypothetical protein